MPHQFLFFLRPDKIIQLLATEQHCPVLPRCRKLNVSGLNAQRNKIRPKTLLPQMRKSPQLMEAEILVAEILVAEIQGQTSSLTFHALITNGLQ